MAVHEIMVAEPHSCPRGFFRHLYARVETHHTGQYWTWWQVDERGIALTDPERAFRTEDAALNDAVGPRGVLLRHDHGSPFMRLQPEPAF